jgi:glycerol-3-phosphate dehydrogenase
MDVQDGKIVSVKTNRGRTFPKLVINAAGVFAEDIARFAKDRFFSIHPRRGTNIIMDKKVALNVRTVASLLEISV